MLIKMVNVVLYIDKFINLTHLCVKSIIYLLLFIMQDENKHDDLKTFVV